MSFKQQLFDNKLTLTLRVRDMLQTRKFETTQEAGNFYSKTIYTPESPIITISAGYNINSYKSKRNRGSIQDSGSGGGGSVF